MTRGMNGRHRERSREGEETWGPERMGDTRETHGRHTEAAANRGDSHDGLSCSSMREFHEEQRMVTKGMDE